jgi:hypothetical protein
MKSNLERHQLLLGSGAGLAGLAVSPVGRLESLQLSCCRRSRCARYRDGNPTKLPLCTMVRPCGRYFPVPTTSLAQTFPSY